MASLSASAVSMVSVSMFSAFTAEVRSLICDDWTDDAREAVVACESRASVACAPKSPKEDFRLLSPREDLREDLEDLRRLAVRLQDASIASSVSIMSPKNSAGKTSSLFC